jgi:hypothetical protein
LSAGIPECEHSQKRICFPTDIPIEGDLRDFYTGSD